MVQQQSLVVLEQKARLFAVPPLAGTLPSQERHLATGVARVIQESDGSDKVMAPPGPGSL